MTDTGTNKKSLPRGQTLVDPYERLSEELAKSCDIPLGSARAVVKKLEYDELLDIHLLNHRYMP